MSIFFLTFILVFLGVAIWQAVRPRHLEAAAYPEHAYLESHDAEPLPDALVQPLGEACTALTAAALECYAELDDARNKLAKGDGHAQMEAQEHLARGLAMAEEVGRIASEALDELGALPEEPGWWLGHAIEQAEALLALQSEVDRLAEGPATAVTRAAVQQGAERTEQLLLAARDFSERLLDFDLGGWVKAEMGRDASRAFERATKNALSRAA